MFMQLYLSPIGQILLTADDTALVALRFYDAEHSCLSAEDTACNDHAILQAARHWLDVYFSGQEPRFMPPLRPTGTTFQQEVWQLLMAIPYGKTTTYWGNCRSPGSPARHTPNVCTGSRWCCGAQSHSHFYSLSPCCRQWRKTDRIFRRAGEKAISS